MTDETTTPTVAIHEIGEWRVWKVLERSLNGFTLGRLLPGWQGPAEQSATLDVHSWVLRRGAQTVIVDTGIGNWRERPTIPFFHHLQTHYLERLLASGVDPAEVTLVVNTHVHSDHVGWNTHWRDGAWAPLFPNARYAIPGQEIAMARTHETHLRTLYADSIEPVLRAGLVDEVLPSGGALALAGFAMEPTPGHTAGHMSLWLESLGEVALFGGDLLHHPVQVEHPEISSMFCADPIQASKTRVRMIESALERGARYFSSHFAGNDSAGQFVRQDGGRGWRWAQRDRV